MKRALTVYAALLSAKNLIQCMLQKAADPSIQIISKNSPVSLRNGRFFISSSPCGSDCYDFGCVASGIHNSVFCVLWQIIEFISLCFPVARSVTFPLFFTQLRSFLFVFLQSGCKITELLQGFHDLRAFYFLLTSTSITTSSHKLLVAALATVLRSSSSTAVLMLLRSVSIFGR